MFGLCSIDGCQKPALTRGWCKMHYCRWLRHNDPHKSKYPERGETNSFIEHALSCETDECIEWPFGRDRDGYGSIQIAKKSLRVMRIVCEKTHGRCPSPKHQVAHSCGNQPCINKRHLRWATGVENEADKLKHGTRHCGESITFSKLSECDVRNIRAEYAKGDISTVALARFFNVSHSNISTIVLRKSWAHI